MSKESTALCQDSPVSPKYAEEKHERVTTPKEKKSRKAFFGDDVPQQKKKGVCPYYFGVKSYLHNFYDSATYKDPSIYEDDDDRYLLNPHARRRRCRPIWLKVCIWIGVNLLVLGVLAILAGYFIPTKSIIRKGDNQDNVGYVDEEAVKFNTTLDLLKLVGLILFCVGGILLAVALMFPTFMSNMCSDEIGEEAIRIQTGEEKPPLSPIEMTIPSTSKVKSVQPPCSSKQKIHFQEDSVNFKD
ncbi:neurensin-1-like [Ostrea edulis]|uniref:neurensin-1-like n=1 Tax=Ostrea edulis TaxID=37623 RepID=UPI0020949FD1|nr:neurensin-1-like [Ostrea edulis]XP_048761504.1 neurensin-1-like [Ostrea edulis]XP_048761505.1 neurensin-1-like [Ostrea edulis]XP_056019611.1 neurensin-1-like [Ostrea edulis]